MKPYDKSKSFMRRVTKRVSDLIPGTTWMNMLLGESQSGDDPTLAVENDDQPPVKKLCTSNNTFTNKNNRTYTDLNPSVNVIDNPRNANAKGHLPEISAATCIPSTSRQSPKFISQSNLPTLGSDVGNRSSLKRKSDIADLSNINRLSQKALEFNFASSTPTLSTANKQPVSSATLSIRSLHSDRRSINNEFLTTPTSQLSRENESQSLFKFNETTTKSHASSPSFRWDTFVNYGELSERQKLFAQKSPLNCSQVMYGGNSARSNLSKILCNTPPIHKKTTIPISPTQNSEIRTTSSILLSHISAKDKNIEENKFIIQSKTHTRHKADQKIIPIKSEVTVKIVDTPVKIDEKSSNSTPLSSGRDTSRKLRANISKKARGFKSEELEMPAKVDLPNITLPMPALPSIKLSNNQSENNEFTFNQPLTLEQFSLQIAEKSSRKKQKMTLKKTHNSNIDLVNKDQYSNPSGNVFTCESSKIEPQKTLAMNDDSSINNSKNNDTVLKSSNGADSLKDTLDKTIQSPISKLESSKSSEIISNNSPKVLQSCNKSTEPIVLKKWTCDTCWVSNEDDKINCVACQTPKPGTSQKPLTVVKSSTWTCESCWVPNKNEIDACVACKTQKPGTTKKIAEQNSNWTCDACWVKNNSDCISCISCGTAKPGCVLEKTSQFKFGLNSNSTFDKSGGTQFKFGFDSDKTDQSSSQCKFGSPSIFKTLENGKSDTPVSEFKFGFVNNKTEQPLTTFVFGTDCAKSQSAKISNDVTNTNNTEQPLSQFKFGLNASCSKPSTQFKFGSDSIETNKPVHQISITDSNIITQPTNELKSLVNNKNEIPEKAERIRVKTTKSNAFKFGDVKQTEKSNCIESNSLVNVCNKSEDTSKGNFGLSQNSQTIQSPIGNTNSIQLVNGHSRPNEDQKPSLIKTAQFFSFGSLAKQDQNLPDDQKHKTFTFGSAISDNKSFVTSTLATSGFPSNNAVFGASNSMFGSGPITTTPATLGSSAMTSQFTFGSMTPPATNSFFSKTTRDNDKNALSQTNSFPSTPNFSFGVPSPPVFSVSNVGGFTKPVIKTDDQSGSTPNNIFNQSTNIKPVKLDPNAPISINFTGGTTTQFTAKPETTEAPKRKILKPVRKIR